MDEKVKWCPQNFQVWVAFIMGMVVIIIAIVLFDNVLGKSRSGSLIPNSRVVDIETKGIDASISSNVQIVSYLKSNEEDSAWLGIEPADVTEAMAKELDLKVPKGVLVSKVVSNSPAAKAGLLRGDIIYEFDHRQVTDTDRLSSLISKADPGDRVKLGLFRQNDRLVLYAVLGTDDTTVDSTDYMKKASGEIITSNESVGIVVSNLNMVLMQQYKILDDEQGVLVMMVVPGSLADNAGVKKGDLIRQVNQITVERISDFFEALQSANNILVLDIVRNGARLFITITSSSARGFAVAQEGIGMNRPLYVPGYDQTQSGDPDSKNTGQIYYDSDVLYNNNNSNQYNNTETNNNNTGNLNNYLKL